MPAPANGSSTLHGTGLSFLHLQDGAQPFICCIHGAPQTEQHPCDELPALTHRSARSIGMTAKWASVKGLGAITHTSRAFFLSLNSALLAQSSAIDSLS